MEELLHITLVKPLLKKMEDYKLEDIMIIGFDDGMNIIDHRFVGTERKEDKAYISLGQVAKIMLDKNYSFLLLAHNHPGDTPVPSEIDLDLTNAIRQLCELIGVIFLDHIIVAKNYPWYSFEESPVDYPGLNKDESFAELANIAYFKDHLEAFKQFCQKKGFKIVKKTTN